MKAKSKAKSNPNELKGDAVETNDVSACPECGMSRSEWVGDKQGYKNQGEVYCCEGCAEGTGCTCGEENPSEVRQEADERRPSDE